LTVGYHTSLAFNERERTKRPSEKGGKEGETHLLFNFGETRLLEGVGTGKQPYIGKREDGKSRYKRKEEGISSYLRQGGDSSENSGKIRGYQ